VFVIVNPQAGRKGGLRINGAGRAEVQAALDAAGLAGDVVETQWSGHATTLARAAVAAGHDLIVAAGGDGTVREVLPVLLGRRAALGILPLGSAMNVARSLDIPRDLAAAVDLLRRPSAVMPVDIGQVNEHLFLEVAGLGVTAGVLHLLNHIDVGRWHRLRTLVRYLRAVRAHRLVLDVDGERHAVRTLSLIVANAPLAGAGVPVAPGALMDDGRLNVRVFLAGAKRDLAVSWFRLALGRPPRAPEIVDLSAATLTVTSRRPRLVHADDELAGATPARFAVLPGAVSMIVGHEPTALARDGVVLEPPGAEASASP
jgi:YegS/Rv2252/BmrU family lipid kinase